MFTRQGRGNDEEPQRALIEHLAQIISSPDIYKELRIGYQFGHFIISFLQLMICRYNCFLRARLLVQIKAQSLAAESRNDHTDFPQVNSV